jgi:hypothetical protein
MRGSRSWYGVSDASAIDSRAKSWGSFYIQILQQQNKLIDEQTVNDLNPLYTLASVTRRHVM